MEEFNFSQVLGAASFNNKLDTKTMEYRINNFIYACGFVLHGYKCDKTKYLFEDGYLQGLVFDQDEESQCNFMVKDKKDIERGNYLYMEGHRKDLDFIFNNYYKNKRIDKRIVELPFDIYLKVKQEENVYQLIIRTIVDKENQFTIIKNDQQQLSFYANILDFSKVLKIVKSFVNNPELVLNVYDEIRNSKKVSFTNGDLKKVMDDDHNFEAPHGKIMKKIKKIMDV